jgi:hypothetical protein
MIKLTKFIVLLLIFLSSSLCFATDYYVSPTGSTSWPNCTTVGSPCLASSTTPGKAFLGAVAGDTVYFLSGTYNPGNAVDWTMGAWEPTNSGSAGNYITFKKYSGTCTLTDNAAGPIVSGNGKSYIIWDGFTAVKTGLNQYIGAVFIRANSSYWTIQNWDITGWPTGASNNCCMNINTASYLTIKNNKFHGSHDSSPDINAAAIMAYSMSYSILEHNEIYDCDTGFYDKDNGSYNTYRYNFIHDIDVDGIDVYPDLGHNADHIYVYQNVIINCGNQGLYSNAAYGFADFYIYNNTLYNIGNYALISGGSGINTLEIFNNIIHTATGSVYIGGSDTNVIVNWNDYYNTPNGGGANSVTSNPNFINPGGTTAVDYKRTSYPTNGRGGGYSNVMGAYITGSEQIGLESGEGGSPSQSHKGGTIRGGTVR